LASSLTIAGIHAAYGAVRVIDDVSFNVGAGETVVLLGTNGNGKSTLMKCIMGIVQPSAGSIIATMILSAAPRKRSSTLASRWCPKDAGCFRN
jgi:branched-chain amino acid transport system ATP-binding protein